MDEVEGYIHDVSHLGKGETKAYFDFKLQMESQTIRGVCFSPGKKRPFEEMAMKKSPVKLKKFVRGKNRDSTDILMNDKVIVEELSPDEITFEQEHTASRRPGYCTAK